MTHLDPGKRSQGGVTLFLLWSQLFAKGQGITGAFVDPGIPCPNDPALLPQPACLCGAVSPIPHSRVAPPIDVCTPQPSDGQGTALCGRRRLWKQLGYGTGGSHGHMGVLSLCRPVQYQTSWSLRGLHLNLASQFVCRFICSGKRIEG